jgi:hypothetical protein
LRTSVGWIAQDRLTLHGAATLLNHMGQFVRQKRSARRTLGSVRSLAKENVLAGSEGQGVHGTVERAGFAIRVDPHAAEIGAKGRFHLCPQSMVQWLSAIALPLDCGLDTAGDVPFVGFASG